jgi:hypothetical protein
MKKFTSLIMNFALLASMFTGIVISNQGVAFANHDSVQDERKTTACSNESQSFLSFPKWYKYLSASYDEERHVCELSPDFEQPSTYTGIAFALLEILLRIAGLVAVVFVIVGGFTFVTSDGQPERAKNARWTIFNALIGLGIVLSATVIVNFIGKRIG